MAKTNIFNNFIVILLCIGVQQCSASDDACIHQDKCLCKLTNERSIDLSSSVPKDTFLTTIVRHEDAEAVYFFHPCTDLLLDTTKLKLKNITKNNCDKPTSLCMFRQGILTDLGKSKDFKFSNDMPKSLIYTNSTNGNITATVLLECVEDAKMDSILAPDDKHVDPSRLIFFSHYACIEQSVNGMGTGWTILLLVTIFMAIYFIGGALVLYYLRGARGTEMIPNVDFWRGLPGLINDGIVFALNGCNPSTLSTAETYDRI